MYEAEKLVISKFGYTPEKIVPAKDAIIFSAGQNRVIALKNIGASPDRAKFIFAAKEHLFNNGFTNIDRTICMPSGDPFCVAGDKTFMVCDMPLGRSCNFDKTEEFLYSIRTLAHLHNAGKGFSAPAGSIERNKLGEMLERLKKRNKGLKSFIKIARKRMNKFDILFLHNVTSFYNDGIEALDRVQTAGYDDIVKNARTQEQLCHYNYFHENVIIDSNVQMHVINFEKICYDSKVYDIVNVLRRKLRRSDWDLNIALKAIEAYDSINCLETPELHLLFALLLFPQKFWRISNEYYKNAGKTHYREKEHIAKMYEIVEEKKHQDVFIKELKKVLRIFP